MSYLLFFDIDGTLCMPGNEPSARTVQAIRKARANGHKTFLSTGRTIASVPPAVMDIGFDGYITNAGANAYVDGKLLMDTYLPQDVLQFTRERAAANRVLLTYQTKDANYTDFALSEQLWPNMSKEIRTYLDITIQLLDIRDTSRLRADDSVYRMVFSALTREDFDAFHADIAPWYSINYFDNFNTYSVPIISGELNPFTIDKGRALRLICDHFGHCPSDAIAFGDSENDTAMLVAAGLGVAVENAQAPVKAVADRICPHCDEDGVARTLEELGLTD